MKIFIFSTIFLISIFGTSAGPPLQLKSLSGPSEFEDDNFGIKRLAENVRLPRTVIPLHYDLQIRPIINKPESDPEQFTSPGQVTIRIKCVNSTNEITLHSHNITIHENITVTSVLLGTSIPVTGNSSNIEISTYTINLGAALLVDQEYDLFIPFTSRVRTEIEMDGLYRSSYIDDSGNPRWLITTQFQKLGARMAFPCWDEPNFRSNFNVTIGRAAEYHSLANSPLRETTAIPGLSGWFWDSHEETVSMPTYLIAIIVSDFNSVEAPSSLSNYLVKTWGPPTTTSNASAEFSSQAAAKIVDFLEKYYDYNFQFPKLDSVAIPHFAAGAMENWALNTYRTNLMLWFEGESTQFEQWRQAAVIGHEIVHHWFGDLVTCDWWNDLWLNEGFARYMQFIAANSTLTQHGIMDRYTIDTMQLAMDYDVSTNSHPVRPNDTETVGTQQSRIIYEKAAALIRMMQSFLTEETLISGLRTYLKKHEYSNTVQEQLFEELQAQATLDGTLTDFTVKEIMDTWTLQTGYPLVRINRAAPGSKVVYVSQERFVPLAQQGSKQNEDSLWFVPINYATKANPSIANLQPKFWLDKNTLITGKTLEDSTDEWVIVNPDARGYYRVLYDDHFFSLIQSQLAENHELISLSSRSQLIDDYFKSALAGYVNLDRALNLTLYLHKERDNTVWTSALNNLRQSYRLMQDSPSFSSFKEYLLRLIEPVLNEISWEQSPTDIPVTVILRSQLLDWACSLDSLNCTMTAAMAFQDLSTGTKIPADVQPAMYCRGYIMADLITSMNVREHVIAEYKVSTRVERQQLFINSMACESNATELGELMYQAIRDTSDIDRKTYGVQLLQRIAENPSARTSVIAFLQREVDPIKLALSESAISSVVSTIASYTHDPAVVTTVNGFIDAYLLVAESESVKNSLASSKQQMQTNSQLWASGYNKVIEQWLTTV